MICVMKKNHEGTMNGEVMSPIFLAIEIAKENWYLPNIIELSALFVITSFRHMKNEKKLTEICILKYLIELLIKYSEHTDDFTSIST